MKKAEFVERHGIEAYERQMKRVRDWRAAHPENTEKWHKQISDWKRTHRKRIIARRREQRSVVKSEQTEKENKFIAEWGEKTHEKLKEQASDWALANPEEVEKYKQEYGQKGEEYYHKKLVCDFEGLPRSRNRVTTKYGKLWGKYKQFVAAASRLHYVWVPEIDVCECVGVVEKNQRQFPFKDVIHKPAIHRWRLARRLLAKHQLYQQPMPLFAEKELYAGVKE